FCGIKNLYVVPFTAGSGHVGVRENFACSSPKIKLVLSNQDFGMHSLRKVARKLFASRVISYDGFEQIRRYQMVGNEQNKFLGSDWVKGKSDLQ
ncbi:hypothetical protein CEXT_76811, partial [Caerostris extrusa]